MRVVIHVGAHKTGTSLVQKYFRDSPGLAWALGIAVVGRGDTNRLIGWGDQLHKRPELLRSRLEKESAKHPAVVFVSHENTLGRPFSPDRSGLYPDAPLLADALAKVCEGFDTQVVFYTRPVPDFVESYYLQTIHQGAWHTFQEWYATINSSSLSWQPAVAALDAAFGADRVVVGDFAEISEGQSEFLRRFMVRSGIPQPPAIDYAPIRNASISARGLEIALDINRRLRSSKERQATRKFLQQYFSNRKEDRARPMPDEVREALATQTDDEYRAVTDRASAALASPAVVPPSQPTALGPKLTAYRWVTGSQSLSVLKDLVQRGRGRR